MEYTNIISLVPQGEHFDTAAVNEGVWLSQGHLDSIENNLVANASVVTGLTSQRDEQALQAQQATAELATANQTIADRDATIASQQAQIDELKKGPATAAQQTTKDADDLGGKTTKFTDPVNEQANRLRVAQGKQPLSY